MKYYIKLYLKNGDKVVSHEMDFSEMELNKNQLKKDKVVFDVCKIK